MGDGVLAYFGYPQAHEHDAERAVRAGLAIVEAAPKLDTAAGSPLQVRVGIATGLVVVGDLIGSGEAQERGVVGDTPNLAARLQGDRRAGHGRHRRGHAQAARQSVRACRTSGRKDLKGIAGPARAWAALRASSAESRFEALHASGLTALVGREEEFELLLRRWSKAKSGEGQVVLLSGEAGIGKSRLTAALLERLAGEPHTRLRYFCSPQHTDSALYPIIGQMERAAGLARDDDAASEARQARCAARADLDLDRGRRALRRDAVAAERRTLSRARSDPAAAPAENAGSADSQIEALARQSPVLMIFEDAHWTDPTSLEAFGRTVDRIASLRVLLIVTFRPEFDAALDRPAACDGAHAQPAGAARSRRHDRPRRRQQAAAGEHPAGHRRAHRRHSAVRGGDDEGGAGGGERGRGAAHGRGGSVAGLAVPASLHASLMARLDRLGPAKEVAQIGAAIGREFSHALLAAVARKPEAELAVGARPAHSGRACCSGRACRRTRPTCSSTRWCRTRPMARCCASRDARLHARIAEALESQFAEIAESQPELLARHCTEAGLIEKAAAFGGKAGQRSLERSALVEAWSS